MVCQHVQNSLIYRVWYRGGERVGVCAVGLCGCGLSQSQAQLTFHRCQKLFWWPLPNTPSVAPDSRAFHWVWPVDTAWTFLCVRIGILQKNSCARNHLPNLFKNSAIFLIFTVTFSITSCNNSLIWKMVISASYSLLPITLDVRFVRHEWIDQVCALQRSSTHRGLWAYSLRAIWGWMVCITAISVLPNFRAQHSVTPSAVGVC